jgi:LmbE family N-acetylglucosaminyl deacetylase
MGRFPFLTAGDGAAFSRRRRKPRLARWLRWRRLVLMAVAGAVLFAAYGSLTSYQAWRKALQHQGFIDEMPAPRAGDRILIFAPHPDDEMLGCGGLIQEALAGGARVDVAVMTNGDASELSVVFGEKELIVSPKAMIALGRARQEESLQALAGIGLSQSRVHFLSYPNNGLTQLWRTEHWRYQDLYTSRYTRASLSPYPRSLTPQTPYCGQQVLSDVIAMLQQVQPHKVFVTHPKDVHPDHWATDCFVRYGLETIAERGGDWAKSVEVYGYLIHWPRYPAPAKLSLTTGLLPPGDLAGSDARWLRLPLSAEEAQRKLSGIRAYHSQMPSFDRLLLAFARSNESFELLPAQQLTPGVTLQFADRGDSRRALQGAELKEVQFALLDRARLRVTLTTRVRKMGRHSRLGLDLRGWDEHGAPTITELQLDNRGKTTISRLEGSRLSDQSRSAVVTRVDPGYSVSLPTPPELERRRSFFLTCWGSAGDHTVDSAVVSSIQVGTGY